MKVIPITPRGFCPGVVRAIKIVEQVLEDDAYPRPIHVLGMIVHNRNVVDRLMEKGAITVFDNGRSRLDLLSDINSGTVIVTAHGAQEAVFQQAKAKGLTVVDATCKDVYKTHALIREHLRKGYEILFVGKKRHPETEAVFGMSDKIVLLESEADALKFESDSHLLFVTNQTTFSIRDLDRIFAVLKHKFPQIRIQDEVCSSTRIRQEAIIDCHKNNQVDLCFIVGDRHSNNTINLARISTEVTGTKTLLIESEHEIKPEDLLGIRTVSVSSGASTPQELTNAVIRFLSDYTESN